ncbi:MAG: AbrB/MazE/SpoVT family DNA-binding domain-containing protein [Candidatus Nanohaloarchaea archaeon]
MTTVTEKGQVTIPKRIRERAGIDPGDDLEFVLEDGELKVRKNVSENPFSDWSGSLETGKSTKEIMEELRGEDRS